MLPSTTESSPVAPTTTELAVTPRTRLPRNCVPGLLIVTPAVAPSKVLEATMMSCDALSSTRPLVVDAVQMFPINSLQCEFVVCRDTPQPEIELLDATL